MSWSAWSYGAFRKKKALCRRSSHYWSEGGDKRYRVRYKIVSRSTTCCQFEMIFFTLTDRAWFISEIDAKAYLLGTMLSGIDGELLIHYLNHHFTRQLLQYGCGWEDSFRGFNFPADIAVSSVRNERRYKKSRTFLSQALISPSDRTSGKRDCIHTQYTTRLVNVQPLYIVDI